MTTPYNQLRQLLTDRHEHLKELSFGCEIEDIRYGVLKKLDTK